MKNENDTAAWSETLALMGETGCGKTTLVSLIPRFYDVTGGAVLTEAACFYCAGCSEERGNSDLRRFHQRFGFENRSGFVFIAVMGKS